MARQFNKRRSAKIDSDNVADASERLSHLITKNNFINVNDVVTVMNGLQSASLPMLQGAIDRAENSLVIVNTLLDVLKNIKKLKETE